jgi:DNA-binding FadR family transcriptional regulator
MDLDRSLLCHQGYAYVSETIRLSLAHAIAEAGKNPYFISYYEKQLGEGQRLLHLNFDYIISAASTSTSIGRDHDEIVYAIAARKPDEAERAAHEHTMLFQRCFLAHLQQNLTEKMFVG